VGGEDLYVKLSLLAKVIRQNPNFENGIKAYPDPVVNGSREKQETKESSRCIHSIFGGLVLPNCGMDDFQGSLSGKNQWFGTQRAHQKTA
jgi:hypothetical protein